MTRYANALMGLGAGLLAALAMSGTAKAQDAGQFYVSAMGGYSVPQDQEDDSSGTTITYKYTGNIAGGVAAGYRLNTAFRFEWELSYRQFDIDEVDIGGSVGTGTDGSIASFSSLINGFLDFGNGDVTPYLGLGIGGSYVSIDDITASSGGTSVSLSGDTTALGYQLMAGASYRLAENVRVFGDYRFVGTAGLEATSSNGSSSDFNFNSHNFMLGARYAF